MIFDGDSFFTLSPGGQAGLALLSLGLWAGTLAVGRRLRHPAWAIVLFWGFVWLSPQIYYLYYLAIIDGLPRQVVVGAPPGPARLLRLLAFRADDTLSDLGQGVLGWSLIGLAMGRALVSRRRP